MRCERRRRTLVGIIPAAGKGSRLAPYPGPKELFPIGWQSYAVNGELQRRPKVISQYILEGMVGAGASRILMVVGEHKYDLLRYYGSGQRFQTSISYLFQEQPRGMAHAIDLTYAWAQDDRILLGMPDTIMRPEDVFCRLLAEHQARDADLTLGLFTTSRPEQFGMVEVDGKGRIVAHVDKPLQTTLHLMWGCAVWEPQFTELIHDVLASWEASDRKRELVLGDVIDEALRLGMHVAGCEFQDGSYIDIGTYDGLVEAHARIAQIQEEPALQRSGHPEQPAPASSADVVPMASLTSPAEAPGC